MKKIKILIPIIILTIIIIALVIFQNPSTRYNELSISQEKWNEIIDSKENSNNLKLENIQFNEYNLPIDKSTDTIYYSLVNSSKTKYNPNISFEANEDKTKLAILQDEIMDEKVHSDYKFKIMIFNNEEYHIYNLVCTDFPILNISYKNENNQKNKNILVDISVFDNMEKTLKRVTNSSGIMDIHDKDYTLKLVMNSPREKCKRKSSFNF